MARQLQLRRGTTAQHTVFTGAVGEVTIDTDKDALVVHDGVQAGGFTAARESVVTAHTGNTSNPHSVTKAQVGLGNVDNTSDANKPVSTATQTALNLKADQATTYTKTEVDTALGLKVDDTEIASVNLLRADKYLSAQAVANMAYSVEGKLSKVQYNNATDVDYEVLTYNGSGKLSNVAHYTTSVLRGNTVLSYSAGKLVSAIYTGV